MEYIILPTWLAAVMHLGFCAIILLLTYLIIKKDERIDRLACSLRKMKYGVKAADEAEAYEYQTTFIGDVKRWGEDV